MWWYFPPGKYEFPVESADANALVGDMCVFQRLAVNDVNDGQGNCRGIFGNTLQQRVQPSCVRWRRRERIGQDKELTEVGW